MKRCGIMFLLGIAAVLAGASPDIYGMRDETRRTGSGMVIVFQAGCRLQEEGFEYLKQLDRELTRLFRPPPGGCRIYVSRDLVSGEIRAGMRGGRREILLGNGFSASGEDPAFYNLLAARILSCRFGLPENSRPLPLWIRLGLESLHRRPGLDIGARHRQHYYPVLRMMLSAGALPDFRALMQMDHADFHGSGREAVKEFSRFLLLMFARLSAGRGNPLGDYTAGMMQGGRPEPVLYRATLLPAMQQQRGMLSEEDFFRKTAKSAAFNHQFPRPAEELLKELPEVLKYSLPASGRKPALSGTAETLPERFEKKDPRAPAAQQQLLIQLQRYAGGFSPELLGAVGELRHALQKVSGRDPEAESAAIRDGRQKLRERLEQWAQFETALEKMERQLIPVCRRLQSILQEAGRREEFLSPAERAFLESTERQYLER